MACSVASEMPKMSWESPMRRENFPISIRTLTTPQFSILEGVAVLRKPGSSTKWFSSPTAHIATAAFIAIGMAAALTIKLLAHRQLTVDLILWIAIAGASVPLLIFLFGQLLKGNFSVDILALLSIITALMLGQPWVAAIVVLMLSGGQALEGYATGRASSVLNALAKRMPQTAHRKGELALDVPIVWLGRFGSSCFSLSRQSWDIR